MKTEGYLEKTDDSESSKQVLTKGSNGQSIYREALAARTVLYQAKNKAVTNLGELRRRRGLFCNLTILSFFVALLIFSHNLFLLSSEKSFEESAQESVANGWVLGCIGISGGILVLSMSYLDKIRELKDIIQKAEKALYNLDVELFDRY